MQLLGSLTQCLTVDPLSTSVWRQLYPKHLSQSRQVGVGSPALTYTEKSPSVCFPDWGWRVVPETLVTVCQALPSHLA